MGRKRSPIPIHRRDGTVYKSDEFDTVRENFELQFERHAEKYCRLMVDEKRSIHEIVMAAMIQGMAYVASDEPVGEVVNDG